MGSVFLSKEELLSGKQFRTRDIAIGERKLRIREPTAAEYLAFVREEGEDENKAPAPKDGETPEPARVVASLEANNARTAKLICRLAVDEKGERLFADDDVAQIREFLGASVLLDVYRSIIRTIREDTAATGG